jgi:hypothetical protein
MRTKALSLTIGNKPKKNQTKKPLKLTLKTEKLTHACKLYTPKAPSQTLDKQQSQRHH